MFVTDFYVTGEAGYKIGTKKFNRYAEFKTAVEKAFTYMGTNHFYGLAVTGTTIDSGKYLRSSSDDKRISSGTWYGWKLENGSTVAYTSVVSPSAGASIYTYTEGSVTGIKISSTTYSKSPEGTVVYGGENYYAWTTPSIIVFTKKESPAVGDVTYKFTYDNSVVKLTGYITKQVDGIDPTTEYITYKDIDPYDISGDYVKDDSYSPPKWICEEKHTALSLDSNVWVIIPHEPVSGQPTGYYGAIKEDISSSTALSGKVFLVLKPVIDDFVFGDQITTLSAGYKTPQDPVSGDTIDELVGSAESMTVAGTISSIDEFKPSDTDTLLVSATFDTENRGQLNLPMKAADYAERLTLISKLVKAKVIDLETLIS